MKRISLILYEALHGALVKCSIKNHRSLHGEIVHALIEYARAQGFEVSDEKTE